MEVHFTPEQETQLSQIATHAGTDVERLVKDAALRLLQEEARFRAAVREGIAQADRGEFIEEEEMDARLATSQRKSEALTPVFSCSACSAACQPVQGFIPSQYWLSSPPTSQVDKNIDLLQCLGRSGQPESVRVCTPPNSGPLKPQGLSLHFCAEK